MNTLLSSPPVQADRRARFAGAAADWSMYLFLILLGVFQLLHYPHASDYLTDVTYPDLARSLVEHGSYYVRLVPETTLPPGLPFILAFVGRFLGFSPAVTFGVVATFTTLGLIAAYELLRRVEGRSLAAIACLLFASCPALFGFNTAVVFPEMAYLFASMAALLLALKIDRARRRPSLTVWILLLGITLAFAVLIRSVGIALLAALVSWTAVSLITDSESGRRRMFRLALPLALGLAAQVGWSTWAHRHQSLEWTLPGYPESYFSQLHVKDGQHPELGLAHLSDIPGRIERNVVTRAQGFTILMLRRNISTFWSSPAICGVLILAAVGLISSLRSGGQLFDWYFLWYECIFMLWPWDYRDRFIFPVVPLTCLYVWRGGKAVARSFTRHPRRTAAALAVLGSVLCICSAAFALHFASFPVNPDHARGDHLQTVAATLLWGALAIAGIVLVIPHSGSSSMTRAAQRTVPVLRAGLPAVAAIIVAFLVGSGVRTILAIGRNRLNIHLAAEGYYPEIEAATWIRNQNPSHVVLMAREPEFVFHYARQTTVWFPPISNPNVLMDGIRRYHVGLIVVTHHSPGYWFPSEEECLHALEAAYPSAFHLVHSGANDWVFQVNPSLGGTN